MHKSCVVDHHISPSPQHQPFFRFVSNCNLIPCVKFLNVSGTWFASQLQLSGGAAQYFTLKTHLVGADGWWDTELTCSTAVSEIHWISFQFHLVSSGIPPWPGILLDVCGLRSRSHSGKHMQHLPFVVKCSIAVLPWLPCFYDRGKPKSE